MTPIQVADLKDGTKFQNQVVLDKQFVLLDSAIPFSKALQNALMEWNFKTVYENENFSTASVSFQEIQKPAAAAPKTISSNIAFEQVDFDIENGEVITLNDNNGLNKDVLNKVENISAELASAASDDDPMEKVHEVYNEYMDYITKVFTRFVTHKELSLTQISDAMKALIEFTKNHKKYLLRIQPTPEQKSDKNYLTGHCLRSTIYSIIIAMQLKMAPQKVTELAVASILHEIGQIRLPPQLYITNKPLSPQARSVLSTHTVLGFNILKEKNFPLSMQLGVLEHHERENGKGYPRKLDGSKISTYGKILAVACTYEAISSPRQYKEAKSTYEAIVEMLRNTEKAYDDGIIKALVQAVSLFPIGAYVYLSNGKIGQVADTNPNDPRTPLVQILGEKNELGNPKTLMTDNEKLRIVRVANREEIKDILAYIG